MVKNEDVAKAFIDGRSERTANYHTDGRTLYSYNTAIARRGRDGTITINNTKYSSTTSKQLGYLKRIIPKNQQIQYTGGKDRDYRFENEFSEDELSSTPLQKKMFKDR
jgi:hypothetical protein